MAAVQTQTIDMLFKAVANSKVGDVQQTSMSGFSVSDLSNALYGAVWIGSLPLVKVLMDKGAHDDPFSSVAELALMQVQNHYGFDHFAPTEPTSEFSKHLHETLQWPLPVIESEADSHAIARMLGIPEDDIMSLQELNDDEDE